MHSRQYVERVCVRHHERFEEWFILRPDERKVGRLIALKDIKMIAFDGTSPVSHEKIAVMLPAAGK